MKTYARLLAIVVTLATAALPAHAQFTSSTVEAAPIGVGDVGLDTSQAILANGNPAVGYYDGLHSILKFATNSAPDGSGTWSTTAVASLGSTFTSIHTSLAIVNGNPAICYYESVLKYVRANDAAGTSWGAPVAVAIGGTVGQHCSLVVVNGSPAISYYDLTNGDLKYVRATDVTGAAWGTPITVDGTNNVGQYTSMAVVGGFPAISYYDVTNADLRYVRATDASGTAWGTPVALDGANSVGQFSSLAVVNSSPAISYFDSVNNDLKYIRATDATGTSWGAPQTIVSANSVGQYTNLRIVSGNPAISYYDVTNIDLKYVRATDSSGTAWPVSQVTVDSAGSVGTFASMLVVNGNPAITYRDFTNGDLKFARSGTVDGSGSWTAVIADADIGRVGQYSSQKIINGNPAIAYYDAGAKDLKFARNSAADGSGTWTITTVASIGDVGQYASLAVVNGNPAISYYDLLASDLKFARNSAADGSGTWTVTTVDSTGIVGQHTSLAIVNGTPAISYYDLTNTNVKFARNSAADGSGTWTTTTITDASASVGQYTSLAVASNGIPLISYFDASAGDLKFARASAIDGSGTWTVTAVDSTGVTGHYTSLAIVNGNPAISYYDATNGDLRFARNNAPDGSGTWTLATLDNTATVVGQYTSLAVINGKPAISYYDTTNGNLKCARTSAADGSGTWVLANVDTPGDTGQYTSLIQVNGNAAISYFDTSANSLRWSISNFNSNADLSALAPSAGTLAPAFSAVTTGYSAMVTNTTASITVTPTTASPTATVQVRVNGGGFATVTSGSPSAALPLVVGTNPIDVKVTAEDLVTVKTYSISVIRPSTNANLSGLALSAGTLAPPFASGTINYGATVPFATANLTVTPTVADGNATVTVNGVAVASGSASGAIAFASGSIVITTVVTAQDLITTKTYTTTVTRAAASTNANLSALTLSAGTLSPVFASGATSYSTVVPTSSLTVTPTVADALATGVQVQVNGGSFASVTSGSPSAALALNVGSNTVNVKVTAQDIITTKTYTVTVTRLSTAQDTDNDGLNDVTEFNLSALGFDWQVAQPALVSTLFNNIGGAQSNLNAAGFYTTAQIQSLYVGEPLLAKNPSTGLFKLTIGVQKSPDMVPPFAPFPMTAPQTLINGSGNLEFDFSVPGDAAFFRVQAQ